MNPQNNQPPKLLDQLAAKTRLLHYSKRTESAYVDWVKRFILFHNKRHPREMGAAEIEAFLTHLAVERNVAASTQNQAFAAILFLYQKVLEIELPTIDALRAKRPERLPVVLSVDEVRRVLDGLDGIDLLQAELLYGMVGVDNPRRLLRRLRACGGFFCHRNALVDGLSKSVAENRKRFRERLRALNE